MERLLSRFAKEDIAKAFDKELDKTPWDMNSSYGISFSKYWNCDRTTKRAIHAAISRIQACTSSRTRMIRAHLEIVRAHELSMAHIYGICAMRLPLE